MTCKGKWTATIHFHKILLRAKKRADKINAKFAIIIGEDEISQNIVNLKNLKTGFQQGIKLGDAINEIKSLLNINLE